LPPIFLARVHHFLHQAVQARLRVRQAAAVQAALLHPVRPVAHRPAHPVRLRLPVLRAAVPVRPVHPAHHRHQVQAHRVHHQAQAVAVHRPLHLHKAQAHHQARYHRLRVPAAVLSHHHQYHMVLLDMLHI